MDKIEVKWLKTQSGFISQVYNSGLEFCFLSDDMSQCHNFVYCKDFLQDAICGHLHSKKATIYGFSYDPKTKPPICMKRTRIALTNRSDDNFRKRMLNVADFINQFAKKLKLKKTQLFEAVDPPSKYSKCGVIVTDGSAMWMNSPPMISMYSLMLRCGCSHTIGQDFMDTINGLLKGNVKPYQNNDKIQLKGAIKGINKILDLGYRKFFYIDSAKNFPKNAHIDTLHNSCGIVGFSNNSSKSVVPYWHRKSIKGKPEGK